ncbi:hypothetical protein [Microbacterium wangruii]|uniref:hypothetical protein n=1 Tax=Microbacterium wangruii TaxID=3049073 RepID=UPI00256F61FD|nr:hypothetical protein [Microbacterium sp. zg-Y1211]MDL5487720.1 hypothetical protein [Microbacterium sp. zg-Y1211]
MPSGFDVSPMTLSSAPERYRAPLSGRAEVFRVWLPGEDEEDRLTVGYLIRQEPDGLAFLTRVGDADGEAMQGARRLVEDLIREGFASGASVEDTRHVVFHATLCDDFQMTDLDAFYASIREEWATV